MRSAGPNVSAGARGQIVLKIVEECGRRDAERLSDVEEPFVEQPALAAFDLHEHVSCHPGGKCDLLLCQSSFLAQLTNSTADGLTRARPSRCAVGIVWTGTRRHAP
jgi:hypothetical protein